MYTCTSMYTLSAGANRGQKWESDPLSWSSMWFESSDGGFCRNSMSSSSMTHLSSPTIIVFFYLLLTHTYFYTRTHCSPRWPGTHYINQAGLEFTALCLVPPLECWELRQMFATTPGYGFLFGRKGSYLISRKITCIHICMLY